MEIKVIKAETLKAKPDSNNLGFGKYFTDYMFQMDYTEDKGWHNFEILPYAPISLSPTAFVLHYGQEVFEGLKAYRSKEGKILLFRPDRNAKRLQTSCQRLCMATVPQEMFLEAVETLVRHEKEWVPHGDETSLYIRPFLFATESGVGVHPSNSYKFIIVLSPVGAYYPEGVNPVKIYVEDEYVRAVQGGTGDIKCGGNYASSLLAQKKAQKLGYTQVLWLDGKEKKYVEEVGTMNAFFKIDGEIYTAPLDGNILPGITRASCIELLKDWGLVVNEKAISIADLMKAGKEGRLQEAWGTGTAAVISPIGELNYRGEIVRINSFRTGEITHRLYEVLTGIQWGNLEDNKNWTKVVK
ncbi:MAG: branched-chain amino acid aminotransferase [Fusobacteriaceae bacterium]